MEILIQKDVFIGALQIINSVTDKSSVKPILSNFLLKSLSEEEGIDGESCIELSATDYEISIIGKFPAKVMTQGSVCVSARKVYEVCKEFQGEEIHIKSTEKLWIHITSGKSELKLPSVEVGLYPQTVLEELPEKVETSASCMKKYIDMTLFAAQTNESRRTLMGVCLAIPQEQKTSWLATDGHRLARVLDDVDKASFKETQEVIIPRKALFEVRKAIDLFDDPLQISFSDRTLQFVSSKIAIKTRLIEGKFPNCDPIIPKDNQLFMIIEKDRFINSLKIISLITTEKLKPVKMTLSAGILKLESEKAEYGEVSDEISVTYEGEEFQIGFNAKYLLDVLNILDGEEVRMEFKNPMSPCVIKNPSDPSFLSVIMPLRIEW